MTDSKNLNTQFEQARALHRRGNLDQAENLYRHLLEAVPDHAGVLHMLGVLLTTKNELAAAEQFLQQAIRINSRQASLHTSLGQALLKSGQTEAAEASFHRALELDPAQAQACFNLGKISKKKKKLEEARQWLEKTLQSAPNHIAARNNLGNVLQELNDTEGAKACFRQVLQYNPNLAEPYYNLGNIHRLQKNLPTAADYYQRAIARKPDFDPAYLEMGRICLTEGQNDAAEKWIRRAIRINNDNAEAIAALGNLYLKEGRIEEAVPLLVAATRRDPEAVDAYCSLGTAYSTRGATSQAEKSFKKALELDPDHAMARFQYGNLLEATSRKEAALEAYRQALQSGPDNAIQIFYYCFQLEIKLGILDNYNTKVQELAEKTNDYLEDEEATFDLSPLILNYFPVPEELHRQVAAKRSRLIARNMAPVRQRHPFTHPADCGKRLRLGYISPDFREHAVGIVINDIFRHHDRETVEIFAYSLVDIKDSTNEKLRKECEHFTDISKISPAEGAKIINRDQIHVLIDLAGYTTFSRPEVLALRPAPIQAMAIGYPNTTGADFTDYILADKWLIPEEKRTTYTEKVVYLSHGFPSSPFIISDKTMTRTAVGVPEEAFVFCCFNAVYKMEPQTLDAWAEILRQAPEAILWLSKTDEAVCRRICRQFEKRDIASDRIYFAEKLPHPEYMARYQLADLFLDTFLYTAGSTAICALHGGIPVLTRLGPTNSARMGASINAAAGLEEMICPDTRSYIERAVYLARHREEAAELRRKLAACRKTAPLFDAAAYTRSVEQACRRMWERYKQGLPPDHFTIEP